MIAFLALGLLGLGVIDHRRKLAARATGEAQPVNVMAPSNPTMTDDNTGLPIATPKSFDIAVSHIGPRQIVPPAPPSIKEASPNADTADYFKVDTTEYFGDTDKESLQRESKRELARNRRKEERADE